MSSTPIGPISPDCKAGKHGACVDEAWHEEREEVTWCRCRCHNDDEEDEP